VVTPAEQAGARPPDAYSPLWDAQLAAGRWSSDIDNRGIWEALPGAGPTVPVPAAPADVTR
jgi:hypothetical protein